MTTDFGREWPVLPDDPRERAAVLDAWVNAEPESESAARSEKAQLIQEKGKIETNLGDSAYASNHGITHEAYDTWRRKAKIALRLKSNRIIVLNDWLRRHAESGNSAARGYFNPDTSLTVALRALAKRAGAIEAVYVAACAWRDNQSQELAAEIARCVDAARIAETNAA